MSDRHDRINSLIHELAATFVEHEANTDPLITVTHVQSSPDYRRATVFVTTIPETKEDDALIFLNRHAGEFRAFLKKRSSFKIIPHIEFAIDRGERHRQNIDRISSELRGKEGTETE